MTQTYRYIDPNGAWTVDLGSQAIRLGDIVGFTESAELGGSAGSGVSLDNPSLTIGHSSDNILGHKYFAMDESAAPSGDQRAYMGLITPRTYARGTDPTSSLRTTTANKTDLTIQDLNSLLSLRHITGTDASRPAETAGERLTWLLGSLYMSGVADYGLVVYPTQPLDAVDYYDQTPLQVLSDIVLPINWNFFVYWSDTNAAPGLFLDNSNRSSAYASTVTLSNVLSDLTATCLMATGTLTRDPERVYSGVSIPYRKGRTYQTDTTTATSYIARDGTAPNANIKTLANAQRQAARFLSDSSTEDDRIEFYVEVSSANVNKIRAGHLIAARWSHLPGYTTSSYFRVMKRIVSQTMKTPDRYAISGTLSPAEPFTCVGLSDINQAHGTVTAAVAVESGNTVWAHASISGWFGGPVDTAVSTIPVNNPTNANDGNIATYSDCPPEVFRYSGTAGLYWISTLDGTYTVCSTKATITVGNAQWRTYAPTSVDYWDGTAWVRGAGSVTFGPAGVAPRYWTFTFKTPVSTTALRLRYVFVGTAGILGLWGFNPLGTRLYDWQIIGA